MSVKIPRLEFEELESGLADVLRARVERLGYLGEIFKCLGHAPLALKHFMEMTAELNAALPDNLTETVALTIASLSGNDYERNQHERLLLRQGHSLEWIAEANAATPDQSTELSEAEIAVQTYAVAAFGNMGKNTGREFDALVDAIGHEQSVAVVILVGRCMTHALAINTLDLAPPVPPVFEEDVV